MKQVYIPSVEDLESLMSFFSILINGRLLSLEKMDYEFTLSKAVCSLLVHLETKSQYFLEWFCGLEFDCKLIVVDYWILYGKSKNTSYSPEKFFLINSYFKLTFKIFIHIKGFLFISELIQEKLYVLVESLPISTMPGTQKILNDYRVNERMGE